MRRESKWFCVLLVGILFSLVYLSRSLLLHSTLSSPRESSFFPFTIVCLSMVPFHWTASSLRLEAIHYSFYPHFAAQGLFIINPANVLCFFFDTAKRQIRIQFSRASRVYWRREGSNCHKM